MDVEEGYDDLRFNLLFSQKLCDVLYHFLMKWFLICGTVLRKRKTIKYCLIPGSHHRKFAKKNTSLISMEHM